MQKCAGQSQLRCCGAPPRLSGSSSLRFNSASNACRRVAPLASGLTTRRSAAQCSSARNSGAARRLVVVAAFAPPTVASTKRAFIEAYSRPIPSIYNTVVQELLVQQHFIRYSVNYAYNPLYALGFVSVFDQILDGHDATERAAIFDAYVRALDEDPACYRADAEKLESQARALSGPDGLVPDAAGGDLQAALAAVAEATASGKFVYNRFFAVGLFRLLELTGAKEPAALERLVKGVGVSPTSVNKDLLLYKGLLSKLSAAKEMMREFLERERKKQAEREAAKATKAAAAEGEGATASAPASTTSA